MDKLEKAARITRFERAKLYTLELLKQKVEATQFESYTAALVKMIAKLQHNSVAYYEGMGYGKDHPTNLGVTFGEKWDKVWRLNHNDEKASVLCFIDADTGLIYKPAGTSQPYPKPRADLYDEDTFENTDPHGGWLYNNYDENKPRNRYAGGRSTKQVIAEGNAKIKQ